MEKNIEIEAIRTAVSKRCQLLLRKTKKKCFSISIRLVFELTLYKK